MNEFNWKRIVIKVGSALIAPDKKGCSSHYLLSIAQFIVRCRTLGVEVVLVSSGSIAAGAHMFSGAEPTLPVKKAMAAAGQTEMMATWDRLFDFPTAQILLTHADLRNRDRYISVKDTIDTLLSHGILPILNENDTVTTDKLKVGDNDNLSAMLAAAANADALIICSDVDGLYDRNPHTHDDATILSEVNEITEEIYAMAGGATSDVGTGGMKTKIEAAEKATSHGIETFIVNGFTQLSFNMLLEGKNAGTIFKPYAEPMQEHVHWMTHTSKAQGEVIVENDFDAALDADSEQLTSDEILSVEGDFLVGDTILVRKDDGTKLANAKSNYSSCLLSFFADRNNEQAGPAEYTSGPIISEKNVALLDESKGD
ncbi:glutamate 5-kinase [Paraglaciecola aquimarina]|uniref:Glutamate 5-kinase n=1 Tax=Paraglaciecola aquimarina TaxID=1235557 RepID=A0ABU3SW53_9ALTE|nr:glutamate 5-kinase [Paraglaciecola aquimarina]MDU0354218.1 glutamate 5-kinase [Paraglaciecola aquimarina]